MKYYLAAILVFLIGIGIIAFFSFAKADIYGSSLVGWWNMDNNQITGTALTDLSGSGNNGTLTNTPTTGGPGISGQSITFDGADDYIAYGAATTFNFGTATSFSYGGWFKTSTDKLQRIMSTGQAGCNNGFMMMLLNTANGLGQIWGGIGGGGGSNCASVRSTTNYADGKWHLGLYVADQTAKTLILYVDGSKAGIQKLAGWGACPTITNNVADYSGCASINADASTNLAIGSHNGTQEYWNGQLEDIRIYNRALSASEVQALYYYGISQHSNGDY